MADSSEALWRAWGLKFVEIVEAMEHTFTVNVDGNLHFFHDTPDGECLQVIAWPKTDRMTSVNLYDNRSSHPVGRISLMEGEVHVGGHGMYHRFKADDVPEFIAFVRRLRTKAIESLNS